MTMPIDAETCQGKPLSPRQARAIDALLVSTTKQEAAERAGIAVRTMTKYLGEPEFQAAYMAAVSRLIGDATTQLKQATSPAIKTLLEVCQNVEVPPSTRVSASRAILENVLRFTEFDDILRRLDELEAAESTNGW